jgi:hypothetical protein
MSDEPGKYETVVRAKRRAPEALPVTEAERGTQNRYGPRESKGAIQAPAQPFGDDPRLNVKVEPPRWPPPLRDPKYIDNAIRGVSYDWSGYVLHWSEGGRDYSASLPHAWILFDQDRSTVIYHDVYPDRAAALMALTPHILAGDGKFSAYIGMWQNKEFPFIVPTLFSDVSTPRIMTLIQAKNEQMRRAANIAAQDLTNLAKGMVIGRLLGGVYSAAQNVRLYDQFAPSSVRSPEPVEYTTATKPPLQGETSSTRPPVPGETTGTSPPPSGATTTTAPSAVPMRRATTEASRGLPRAKVSGLPAGVRESRGANTYGPMFQSASAQTQRSVITAVRADVGESQAYMSALRFQGEIGLQRPSGANVRGTDFITAGIDPQSNLMEIIVTDVKTSTTGRFPKPETQVPAEWMKEVRAAVARLDLGDPALEQQIRQALQQGRVRLRQLNADYSSRPQGQGTIRGW